VEDSSPVLYFSIDYSLWHSKVLDEQAYLSLVWGHVLLANELLDLLPKYSLLIGLEGRLWVTILWSLVREENPNALQCLGTVVNGESKEDEP
jgi:hypothetical protein